jgi:hypothetical protein
VNIAYHSWRLAGALLLAGALTCAADDDIKVYTVPKEHPAMQLAQAGPAAPDIPVNAAPIHWTLPAGWTQKPAEGIRKGSFAIAGENGGKAEVAITSFPGAVGTGLDNVNRWRRELSLEPIGEGELASEPVPVGSSEGKLYDLAGQTSRTVVAVVQRNGNSWFIKLRGDSAAVAGAKPVFLDFLKSIRFGEETAAAATAQTDPHAGLAAPDASSDLPKWDVPAHWVETAPHTMILKSFEVTDDGGAKAEITVSSFAGEAGGVLGNVNRWRGQLGQAPIDASQLDGVTESLATPGGKATMVDFMGANPQTGQPARMVGVIMPHGDSTWFYKMMGDAKAVGGEKDSFVQFVKTVHYP